MSTINAEKLIPLLTKNNVRDDIADLVRDILVLQDKINHPERESEYFQWGIANHKKDLENLKANYEHERQTINKTSIDDFLEQKNKAQNKLDDVLDRINKDNGFCGFMRRVELSWSKSAIREMDSYINAKAKYGMLKSLDEEDLKRFFE